MTQSQNGHSPTPNGDDPVLDVVGIGFGPSNLGLAIAVEVYPRALPSITF